MGSEVSSGVERGVGRFTGLAGYGYGRGRYYRGRPGQRNFGGVRVTHTYPLANQSSLEVLDQISPPS